MTNRQKTMLEDQINAIQRKIDEAWRYMDSSNFLGRHEEAERWSSAIDDEVTRMNGIRIALSVLGYSIGWEKGKRKIINAGAKEA